MTSFEVREACSDDKESVTRVLWKAFDQTKAFDEFQKEDWLNRWNNQEEEDWAFVAVEDGKSQANLCFFAHEDNVIRGRPQRFGGVWAVATSPNQRRQGMIRELFRAAFPKMRQEGCYLSILDPFYVPFYEQFGYALSETFAAHEFTRDIMKKVERLDDITSRELLDTAEWEKVAK
ncbi:MAG: GNAT family N-acetyltransferase, partial [Promethearchaeota archaeon]